MKIKANKKTLVDVLTRAVSVSDPKSTMPILGNVLLRAGDGCLRIVATDLELTMSAAVTDSQVERDGEDIAVSAKDLLARVRAMPAEVTLDYDMKKSSLKITGAGSKLRYVLPTIAGDEFPAIESPNPDATWIRIPGSTLAKLINTTWFSVSTDDTRLHLNSALLELNGKARMVSTDGHRLSRTECDLEDGSKLSILVPLPALKELRKLAEQESISVCIQGRVAFVVSGNETFSFKVPEAQFPPWDQVVPKDVRDAATVDRAELLSGLKAVSLAADARTGGVKISLSKTGMKLTSGSADSGDSADDVSAEYDGPDVTVGVNARYMADWLSASESEKVDLFFGSELDPVKLEAGEMLGIVMPMRI